MSAERRRTWFITGASRGLGRAFADAALGRGDVVVATSRNPAAFDELLERFPGSVLPLRLDVTDSASIETAFAEAVEKVDRIDVVVNSAGFVLVGAMEEMTEEDARREMETLFFGPLFVTRAAARHMRERGGGTIVQMSSLAAISGLPGHTMYAAAKWALEGMTEAARKELGAFGIRFIILEPSGFRTTISDGVVQSRQLAVYDDVLREQRARYVDGSFARAKGDPRRAAEVLLDLLANPDPPKRLLMGDHTYDSATRIWRERLAEAETWETVSRSLNFPEGE